MKKLLFGIALILFGIGCFLVNSNLMWNLVFFLGICLSVIGLLFCCAGYLEND